MKDFTRVTTYTLSVQTVSDSCLAATHLVLALKPDQQSEHCWVFLLLCNVVRHTHILYKPTITHMYSILWIYIHKDSDREKHTWTNTDCFRNATGYDNLSLLNPLCVCQCLVCAECLALKGLSQCLCVSVCEKEQECESRSQHQCPYALHM